MSIATLILGNSGSGKSASLRNFDPTSIALIQAVKKPLPFRSGIQAYVCDNSDKIVAVMKKTERKVIVIDDFQYIMANEFMRRSDERGFDKFTDIGRHAWDIFNAASALPEDVRVYILGHTEEDDRGKVKMKTIGKMLDEKITLEGLVTIVLRTSVQDGTYQFSTRNSGSDSVKAPMGMFDADRIDNDLAAVDAAICNYYSISSTTTKKAA